MTSSYSAPLEDLIHQAQTEEFAGNWPAARSLWCNLWQQDPGNELALAAIERLATHSLHQEVSRLEEVVSSFLTLSNFLSQKYELRDFLSLILSKARALTWADAGSVYLIDREGDIPCICFAVAQNGSYPEKSLDNFAVPVNKNSLVGYVSLTAEILNIPDVNEVPENAPFKHQKTIESDIEYITQSILTLPILASDARVAGVMQLINRKIHPQVTVAIDNISDVVQPFTDGDVALLRSLSSLTAISIERHHLLRTAA